MKYLKNKLVALILVVVLIGGCDTKNEIKVSAEKKQLPIIYEVGDTLYYEYIPGQQVMFIIEKIDIEQRVFVGRVSNIYDQSLFAKDILSFQDYMENRN